MKQSDDVDRDTQVQAVQVRAGDKVAVTVDVDARKQRNVKVEFPALAIIVFGDGTCTLVDRIDILAERQRLTLLLLYRLLSHGVVVLRPRT